MINNLFSSKKDIENANRIFYSALEIVSDPWNESDFKEDYSNEISHLKILSWNVDIAISSFNRGNKINSFIKKLWVL